jgi:PST family polysaccharide transporter
MPEAPALQSAPGTPPENAPAAAGLARTTGRGAAWMVASQVGAKFAMSVAQIILGWILSEDDFGVYASAIAFAAVLGGFRDGGVRELLIQRGAKNYAELVGPVFWLAFAINCVVALILAGASLPVAAMFDDARMIPILLVVAVSLPLATPSAILQTRLRMDLRFPELAQMTTVSAMIRQFGSVVFALMGFGPVSFVLPLIVCGIYEALFCMRRVVERPWRLAARVREWGELLRSTRWLIFGAVSNIVLDQGGFLTLGLIVSKAVVGFVYFGFWAMMQTAVLLSFAVQQVLMPVIAKLNSEPERQRAAVLRAFKATLLISGGACVTLAAVMGPLESIIWHGRWEPAVLVVQVFGIFFAMRCTFGLTTAVLQAQGRFKRWSVITLTEGLFLVVLATIGAYVGGWESGLGIQGPYGLRAGPTDVALWSAGALGLTRYLVGASVLSLCGASLRERLAALIPSWLLGGVAMLVSALADLAIFWGGGFTTHGWSGGLGLGPKLVAYFGASPPIEMIGRGIWPFVAMEVVRLLVLGAICTLAYAALVRVFIRSHVEDTIAVMPAKLRRPVRRAFLLREKPVAAAGEATAQGETIDAVAERVP